MAVIALSVILISAQTVIILLHVINVLRDIIWIKVTVQIVVLCASHANLTIAPNVCQDMFYILI